ncbi:hypothetical protein PG989_000142 [Apiospora arundinis]
MEGARQGSERQWRSREGQEKGREEGASERREEWEERMRHKLRRREAEETARRAEETTRIAMPNPGMSSWQVDLPEDNRRQEWESHSQERQGREEDTSQRREEWEEHMRRELLCGRAEEAVRETAKRVKGTARIAMPVPGISTWQLDVAGGDRPWRGEPAGEPSAGSTAPTLFDGLAGTNKWRLEKVGAAEPLHREGLMARTIRLPVETPAAPTREDRQRRHSPGGRVEDSEETMDRLRERAEQISRESQNQREGETESQEVRQWLQRHRQQREEARRREWTNHTRLRREQARGRRSSSPNRKEADRYTLETIAQLKVALSRVLAAADKAFEEKQAASDRREWCEPIPLERKVETVRSFLKAFHDEDDMEIAVCSVCYLQKRPRDLDRVDWRTAVPEQIRLALADTFACKRCFPEEGSGVVVPVCVRCREAFDRGRVPEACMGGLASIGCEHRYPKELEELRPLEEKLISLNAAYGFITKFNVQRGQPTGPTYRKHITGHITVFPNDVESLAAVVLPHPLVAVLKDVHVMWTGPERPTPREVSKLLTVRPQTQRAALGWLRLNNPLYKEVIVAEGEIGSWQFESGTFVPIVAYQHMVREDETAEEQVRTAHVAPPGDRGRESPAPERTAEDIVKELVQGEPRAPVVSVEEAVSEETAERVFELRSTAMFPIDEEAALADQDKLAFIGHALEKERQGGSSHVGGEGEGETPSIEVRSSGERPFVRVLRGRDFADSFSPDFFPKTFPTCFPYGRGGPRAAVAEGPLRDMTLESWTDAHEESPLRNTH